MNLATKITLARIVLIPVVIVLYVLGFHVAPDTANASNGIMAVNMGLLIAAAIVYAIAAFTDFLDGNIARRTNTVTTLGKFLDPIADKCLIVVTLVLLIGYQVMPEPYASILVGLILSREFIIGALRQIAASKGYVLAADGWGKIKTVFTDFAVGFLIVAPLHVVLYYIGGILFVISAFLTFYSGINYIWKNRKVFSDNYVAPSKEEQGMTEKEIQDATAESD